ncbi:hypothetical protein [Nocardioides jensenii]|uniref:hypothetical protein n=1 Tax=Nocardioides jensenii TaxID=1843 RepID=UPI000AEEEF6E|nr:hypothetical protein [Nocardioides jensenii]
MTSLLAAALLLTATSGCDDNVSAGAGTDLDPKTVVVTVDWVPASIPDNPVQSKTLELSADGVVTTQGSGAPDTVPMDATKWEEFVADLPEELEDISDGSDCVGAGGTILEVDGAGELDTRIVAMICGGASEAGDQIDALVSDFA